MEKQFNDFAKKRLNLFKKIIKQRWKKSLTNKDLEKIANDFVREYEFDKKDIPFIKNHIRVAMWQNPSNYPSFDKDLENLHNNHPIESPILTKIDSICEVVDEVKDCKNILDKLKRGEKIEANFIEGIGCDGGCVGGPKTNISKEKGTKHVNQFSEDSIIMTPMDNMNIIKILQKLGANTFEDIYKNEKISKLLTRKKCL